MNKKFVYRVGNNKKVKNISRQPNSVDDFRWKINRLKPWMLLCLQKFVVFFFKFDLERVCKPVALVLCGYVPALFCTPL